MPSPDDMLGAVASSIEQRTGRSLDEWLALVAGRGSIRSTRTRCAGGCATSTGCRQNTQWALADAAAQAAGWVRPSVEDYVDGQFGGREGSAAPALRRRPGRRHGAGTRRDRRGARRLRALVRRRQFAAVAVLSARLDLGLRLPDPPASARLLPAKAPGQATHKVELREAGDVDDELRGLLGAAYDQNG